MAYVLGAVLGTMLDPLVLGAGIACYFIYRKWGLPSAFGAAVGLSVILFVVVTLMARGLQLSVPGDKLGWLFLAMAAWAAICYAFACLHDAGRTQ